MAGVSPSQRHHPPSKTTKERSRVVSHFEALPLPHHGLVPRAIIEVAGVKARCLFDTGASVNILSKRLWQTLERKKMKMSEHKFCLFSVDGTSIDVVAEATIATTLPELGRQLSVTYLISDISEDVLLGHPTIVAERLFDYAFQSHAQVSDSASRERIISSIENRPLEPLDIEPELLGGSEDDAATPEEQPLYPSDAVFAERLKQVVKTYHEVFNETLPKTGAKVPPMSIKLKANSPGVKPHGPRRMAPLLEEEVRRQVRELLDQGVIVRSNSTFSAPVLLIKKPHGKGYRFCVDYRSLNKETWRDESPLPNCQTLLAAMAGKKFFAPKKCSTPYVLSG